MKFEEFEINKEVVHILRKEWGKGVVVQIFGDRSVLVYFPLREETKFKHKNTFRYYEKGLKDFREGK